MVSAGESQTRTLSAEQRRLLEVFLSGAEPMPARSALGRFAVTLADILQAKVAFVTTRHERPVLLAESSVEPPLPPADSDAWRALDALGGPDTELRVWTFNGAEWTVVSATPPEWLPLRIAIAGDWSNSAEAILKLTEALWSGETAPGPRSPARVGRVAHRLTVDLGRATGAQQVCEIALRHVVRAVPSRLAAFAIPTSDDQLSIIATHGYPRALVEGVRITTGVGVIGSVYRDRTPLHVTDVGAFPGLERRRPRYRTNSFIALPITAGAETLGVLCVTDRLDDKVFTREDVTAMRTLMAPTGLALARESARRQAQLFAQAAVVDPVSGLFNRRYFHDRLQEELLRADRHNLPVALLMVDIDDFKTINDRFGHVVGDLVIRDVADILRRSVRVFDVCTRFGGEEFAIVMPGSRAESAASIAERIRRRIEEYAPADRELTDLRLTASIGLSVAHDLLSRDLVERADRALYDAKRAGKNRVSAVISAQSLPERT